LLALASGAKTLKMKFGHHGANHPVQDLATGRVMITSQNHGFAVDEATLPANLRATHKSLFDGSLQGIHRTDKPAFSFQGHPELHLALMPMPCLTTLADLMTTSLHALIITRSYAQKQYRPKKHFDYWRRPDCDWSSL